MALEQIKAQIELLVQQMINQPADQRELQEMLREKFRELRAQGLTVPDDLLELERRLDEDFYKSGT